MKNFIEHCCEDMELNVDQLRLVDYNEVFDEYGLPLNEDNVSYILLNYCPWCGKRLPPSKREEWVDQLEKKGFLLPFIQDEIPYEYKSALWRNSTGDDTM